MNEIVVQVRDVFEKYFRIPQGNVIEEDKMLMNLSHISDVGNHGHAVLSR